MKKSKVKYTIEFEVDNVARGDVDRIGDLLVRNGESGLSSDETKPLKLLDCVAKWTEEKHIPF
jgi:hypothetical protein